MSFAKNSSVHTSGLDLNKLLIKNPSATFFVKVSGNSLEDFGIFSDDTLIVDRSLVVLQNSLMIVVCDEQFKIAQAKEIEKLKTEYAEVFIWGIVISVIHKLR